MSQDSSANNKRLVKNTLFLYCRTFMVMAISLYTSRVVLDVLGIEDYGVYNVVGGVVGIFAFFSGSLSGAISRFLIFELGKGDSEKLKNVFSTSLNILLMFAICVFIIGEIWGLWFIDNKLNIDSSRVYAAKWVLHFSLVTFGISLVSVPYNAAIVAHEKMSAFAYIGMVEAALKLLVAFFILRSPIDKLIFYSFLLTVVATSIRFLYSVFCHRNFDECRYSFSVDKSLLKEMFSFTGWSFVTRTAYTFNTEGVSLLINLFFGVIFNAARGVANQIQNVFFQFVSGFTTALTPQITKYYANGEMEEMHKLICRGAKFSYFLMMIFAIPLCFESEFILSLWLKEVPEHTSSFLRLTMIACIIDRFGDTGAIACRATGNIKRYALTLSSLTCMIFPITWVLYVIGGPAEITYVVFSVVYVGVDCVRLWLMKKMISFSPMSFIKKVFIRTMAVTALSLCVPMVIVNWLDASIMRLFALILLSTFFSLIIIYMVGLEQDERISLKWEIRKKLKKV